MLTLLYRMLLWFVQRSLCHYRAHSFRGLSDDDASVSVEKSNHACLQSSCVQSVYSLCTTINEVVNNNNIIIQSFL